MDLQSVASKTEESLDDPGKGNFVVIMLPVKKEKPVNIDVYRLSE